MVKKVKAAEKTAKKKKTVEEETQEEHQTKHAPDVKRLLEEYEEKDGLVEDEDFAVSEQFDADEEDKV